jgi:3-hydroxyisobutyrate dehydrogenase-like beta-hydroxyacid dehydrogenase
VFGDHARGLDGLSLGLMPGAVHLSMSTAAASAHARSGQDRDYVAAPVFGNPDAAKGRQLFIVAAGTPADVGTWR